MGGEQMSEEKRQLIRDVTTRINKLPEDKKHYILGYMNGVADTVESNPQKKGGGMERK
jgi:hypothetical protein